MSSNVLDILSHHYSRTQFNSVSNAAPVNSLLHLAVEEVPHRDGKTMSGGISLDQNLASDFVQ